MIIKSYVSKSGMAVPKLPKPSGAKLVSLKLPKSKKEKGIDWFGEIDSPQNKKHFGGLLKMRNRMTGNMLGGTLGKVVGGTAGQILGEVAGEEWAERRNRKLR